ncbi:MAG: ribosome maturation factor RimM [Kofleriaceae bacterium]
MRGDARIEIGGIARAHGIRGEVVVHTHDPDSTTLASIAESGGSIYIGGAPHKVLVARDTPQRGWLVQLEGISTRNEAELLQGKPVEIDRGALELDEGDVLLDDMVGCKVVLRDGTDWGVIAAIDLGPQDLLVIHDGEIERLLPLVDQFVVDVDIAAGTVTVDPPPGLPESRVSK